jgi:hypothetical protein
MMTTIVGFFACALALGAPAAPKSVATVAKGMLIFPVHFIKLAPYSLYSSANSFFA